MRPFDVPTENQVTAQNRQIFESLKSKLGFVPNIYATYAYSQNALARYLQFANGATSLSNKEKEIVNLAVSQVNGCSYCLAAHTTIGKMNGFDDDDILAIRKGTTSFGSKFDALTNLVHEITANKGSVTDETLEAFFAAGYTRENLVDVIVGIGEKTTTNLLHNVTDIPVDFPVAPEFSEV